MPIVTSGSITITDVSDGLNIVLSQGSYIVATDAAGAGGDFAGATTTVFVMVGSYDDTASWTISANASPGVIGNLVGRVYAVSAMTVDTGYVDLTVSRAGYPSMVARFNVSKARQGVVGPGLSLTASAAGFTFTDGVALPATQTIAVRALRQGADNPVLFFASNGAQLETDAGVLTAEGAAFGLPLAGDGETCYIDLADFGAADQMYVTAICGEATAVLHLARINYSTAEPGATRNVFRGNHALGTIYAAGDQVIYGGSGWTARVQHLASGGNVPPTLPIDQNTWWTLAAVQGQPGANGANGAQGERGTKQVAVATAGTVWSDSEANAALSAAGWGAPIQGDVVTLFNSTAAFSQTRVRSGGVWSPLAAFFGGDVLVDGTVEGRHLKVGTITTDKITIGGTNLIANADFATGDFTNWVKADNPLGSSVVARTTSGVPAGAPTAYVARFLPSGTGTISLFAAARAYNMPGAAQDGFPVSAGEIYSISVEAAKAAAFAATGLQLRVYFILNDGTYTTNIVPLGFLTAVTTSWASYSASFTVPANAVRGFGFISVYGLTAGALYWTNLRIQKKVSAAGIIDGSVGPTQLDQAALAVAGLAVFGGTLQSTDYVPGVSGWALDNAGDAELNSLVVRTDMIVVGATEARLDHFSSSTFDIASGAVPNNVVVLLDVPATCVSTATVPAIVEFEARFRNDVEAKTRLAFRLTALTGPSDHPETGDWTNLGVEYVYLHPASQQLIDYKKCIWFLNDFDLTTATKLRLRVEYFTSGGVWTGTDTAMEKRIFSLRQSKRV